MVDCLQFVNLWLTNGEPSPLDELTEGIKKVRSEALEQLSDVPPGA